MNIKIWAILSWKNILALLNLCSNNKIMHWDSLKNEKALTITSIFVKKNIFVKTLQQARPAEILVIEYSVIVLQIDSPIYIVL